MDLEKVESLGDKQTLTEELLEDIFDTTTCDQFNISSSNSSTLNKCDGDRLFTSNDILLEDKKEVLFPSQVQGDRQTVTEELLEDIFDATACDQFNLSSSNSSTLNKWDDNLLSSSNDILLEDKKEVPARSNDSTSNQLLKNKKEVLSPNTVPQPSAQRRVKGDGSGCIYWRTVVRNCKNYQQAYYQYEFWQNGQCLLKSTKYIPKKLWQQVLKLNQDKVPVSEILAVLGGFVR